MRLYRWDTPQDWLEEKAKEWDAARLYQELMALAQILGPDQLQDEYQIDMARDGYFDKIEDDGEAAS